MHFFNSKTYLMVLSIATIYGGSRADPTTEEACIQACKSSPDPLNLDLSQISVSDTPAEDYHDILEVHRNLHIELCMLRCKEAEAMETFKDIFKAASSEQLQAMRPPFQPFKVPALLRWAAYVIPYLTSVIEVIESMHDALDGLWLELKKDVAHEESSA